MGRHECDCGRVYQTVAALELCAANDHGYPPRTCDWWETPDDADGVVWKTKCGDAFFCNDGTPTENRFQFCCFCGAPINEITRADQVNPIDPDPGPIEDRDCDYWERLE